MNIRRFRLRNPTRCPVLVEPPPSEETMAHRADLIQQMVENQCRHMADPLAADGRTVSTDIQRLPVTIVPMSGPEDFKCTAEF